MMYLTAFSCWEVLIYINSFIITESLYVTLKGKIDTKIN